MTRSPNASCLLAVLALTAACGGPAPEEVADLVLRNGKVVTVDESLPEANALAVKDGTILAVGSDAEIDAFVGDATEVVDLEGRLAIPGFIEGHAHFMSLGDARMILDLTRAGSWSDIVAMVGEAARDAEPGEWILGRGWHQEKWDRTPPGAVEGLPDHAGLSEVSPDNPVLLEHASGHASFANLNAMELAGVGRETADPDGGTIVRGSDGMPSGALRESADELVREVFEDYVAGLSEAERRAADVRRIELAGADLLSKGITSFQDAGTGFATIDLYRELAEAGQLPVRLYVMVGDETNESLAANLADYKMHGGYDGFLTVRSIKKQIDGALGPHGAWLLEPYEDLDTTGLVLQSVEEIEGTAAIALEHDFQVNTHAIGDRANREVLDIYERAFETVPDEGTHRRWRIEHAQHLHPDDLPRFADLGVIAAMQGVHCTSDAPWVYRRLGAERAESGAYMWRALIDSGALVTNGTDAPVEDADPIASYYASVARVTGDGSTFFPDQAMSREEALRSYTLDNAYAAFEEDAKGSLTPGKYADITVLSQDILTIPVDEIPSTRVELTIVGGEIRYRR